MHVHATPVAYRAQKCICRFSKSKKRRIWFVYTFHTPWQRVNNSMSGKQKERSFEETAESLLEVVRQLAAELQPGRKQLSSVTLDSSLDRDLGLDSLARVELLIRIGRTFEVMLSEQVLASAETPRDLLRAVLSAGSPKRPRITPDLVKPAALEKADAAAHGAQTLVEVLDRHVLSHPDRPHILLYGEADHPVEITYQALKQGAETVAAGLRQRDLEPGQTVAIMLPTSREYFFSFFGVLLGGGIPVPLYPPMRPTQIEEHLRRHRKQTQRHYASWHAASPCQGTRSAL